jgi:hypothetical protein
VAASSLIYLYKVNKSYLRKFFLYYKEGTLVLELHIRRSNGGCEHVVSTIETSIVPDTEAEESTGPREDVVRLLNGRKANTVVFNNDDIRRQFSDKVEGWYATAFSNFVRVLCVPYANPLSFRASSERLRNRVRVAFDKQKTWIDGFRLIDANRVNPFYLDDVLLYLEGTSIVVEVYMFKISEPCFTDEYRVMLYHERMTFMMYGAVQDVAHTVYVKRAKSEAE